MGDNSVIANSLQIAFWNAGFSARGPLELEEFAGKYELDLILVSETWLQHRNPQIQGFTMYR